MVVSYGRDCVAYILFRFSVVLLYFFVLVFEVVRFSSVLPGYVKRMVSKDRFAYVSFLYVLVS